MKANPLRHQLIFFSALALAIAVGGCGGGGGNEVKQSAPGVNVQAAQLSSNSYANFKSQGLVPQALPEGDNTMRAFGNFTGSGRLDMFRAVLTYDPTRPPAEATPGRFEFFTRQTDGTLVPNTSLLPNAVGCLHPRKSVVADFNGDGKPDVFVACHGYDAAPFPGEKNKIVLSQPNGTYVTSDAAAHVGFNHGASAADLNGDGFIDVVVADNFDSERAFVLLNDGTGHFTREVPSRLPVAALGIGNYYSVELVDVDEDSKLDLVLGGHEFDAAPTKLFLNPGTNNFAAVSGTVIPAVANEGVVLDFTVTGTGATRTIWVLRTSGGDGTFYQSKVVQKVAYPAMTSSVVLNQRPATWAPWLVPAVVNGTAVVASDNAQDSLSVTQ